MTDVLSPFINDGDKEPSWDGHIYIHKDKRKNKEGIKRIPVQIKGKLGKISTRRKKTSFSIECRDLDNWLQDGGIMLFVVVLDETGTNKAIYYSALLPILIRDLRDKNTKGSKRIKIQLKIFPTDNKKKVSILLNFYHNRQKQASFVNAPLYSIEKLAKEGILENISISGIGCGENYVESILCQQDIYLYAKVKGSSIPQPLPYVQIDKICIEVTRDVKIKQHVFYSKYSIARSTDKDEEYICIGKSITLSHILGKKNGELSFKVKGTLSDYIIDTECIIAVMENREITINGVNFTFDGIDNVNIEQYKQNLLYYKNLKKALYMLGVKKELECDNLSEQDQNNIRNLINALVLGRNIEFTDCKYDVTYGYIKLANLKILIWAERERERKNAFRIQSYFSNHKFVELIEENKNKSYPITQYLLLKKRDFLDATNIDYEKIVEDISQNDTSPIIINQIILFMLEMLKAYDEQKTKDEALLKTAETYCDWITKKIENSTDIMLLNHLQIIKRRRCLDEEETSQLYELMKTNEKLSVKCGACILLEKMELAQHYFDKMGEKEKEDFMNYPICNLGKLNYSTVRNCC